MELFLNAGMDKTYGHLLKRFEELGLTGTRIGITPEHNLYSSLNELRDWVGHKHVYLITGDDADEMLAQALGFYKIAKAKGLLDRVYLQVGNEPELSKRWKKHPEDIGKVVNIVASRHEGLQVLTPGINIHDLRYADDMLSSISNPGVWLALHRYAVPLSDPMKGFPSRAEEIRTIDRLREGRKYCVTETGMAQVYKKGLIRKRRFTEEEVAEEIVRDWNFWQRHSEAQLVIYYQLNDGPRDTREDRFGWRHMGERWWGPWKAVARLFQS